MCKIYVLDKNAKVRLRNNQIEVMEGEEIKSTVPFIHVESIHVYGQAHITTPLIMECLSRNLPVSFHSYGGRYLGRLMGTGTMSFR